jgi:hypothetical protein
MLSGLFLTAGVDFSICCTGVHHVLDYLALLSSNETPLLVHVHIGTPFSTTFNSIDSLISLARAFSSSTSQLTHTNFPLRNSASGDASQTWKQPGSVTVKRVSYCSTKRKENRKMPIKVKGIEVNRGQLVYHHLGLEFQKFHSYQLQPRQAER